MNTKIDQASFRGLIKLAAEGAQWQLQRYTGFSPVFMYVENDATVGCVMDSQAISGNSFKLFVEAIRHLAIAQNVTKGVFVNLMERISEPTPDYPGKDYILLAYQSRTDAMTFIFPVHRKADGAFSHLGLGKQANHLPELANIVPGQEPNEVDRMTSKIMLQKYKLGTVL